MRLRSLMLLALMCAAMPAHADGGSRPEPTPSPATSTSGTTPAPGSGASLSSRQQAEQWYADAYDDIAKGKQEAAAGKAKNAEKRFKRALERAMRATEFDSTYHEAWNLAGFAARKLGDYPGSLAAYRTSIRLNGDYAPAREYYGQALLESGDMAGAELQLAWLDEHHSADLAAQLRSAIEARKSAAPGSH